MVTLTVTPMNNANPPAMRVTIAMEDSGYTIKSSVLSVGSVTTRLQFENNQSIATLDDIDAPYGTFVTYRATGEFEDDFFPGVRMPFDVSSEPASLDPSAAWLINPIDPSLSIPVDYGVCVGSGIFLQNQGVIDKSTNVSVLNPVGREKPIVISRGPRNSDTFELSFLAYSAVDSNKMIAALKNQSAVLLQIPPYFDYGINSGWYYVGDLTISRPADFNMQVPIRKLTLPVTAAMPPTVVSAPIRSYGTVLVEAGTYVKELDINPTYALVESGS